MGIGKGGIEWVVSHPKSGNGRFVHRHCGAWEALWQRIYLGGLIAIYIAYIWRTFVIFSLLIGLGRALRLCLSFLLYNYILCRADGAVL